MERTPPAARLSRSIVVLAVLASIAALHFAADVLVPVAMSVLLAFALAPLVKRLERIRIPRVPAVCAVMVLFVSVVIALGWVLHGQALQLATDLPRYKTNISTKLAAIRGNSTSALDRATATLKEIGDEMTGDPAPPDKPKQEPPGSAPNNTPAPTGTAQSNPSASSPAPTPPPTIGDKARTAIGATEPTPVRIVGAAVSPLTTAESLLGPVISRIATAAIVIVFTTFILVQREELRNRLVRLMGNETMHQSTPALDDAASRVSRYLLLQLVVNSIAGVLIGIGLTILDVPGALLWGVLTIGLRFIPYVGTFIAAAFPIILSMAVAPDWRGPLMVAALVTVVEVGCGQVVEPLIVGSGTGLSPIAVLASALFWGWLWGPVGLLLSTPIAVCLAVAGKHFPRLAFLNVLLSNRVALPPPARLYQRLLAGDAEEASRIVATFRTDKPLLIDTYEGLIMPALRLAQTARAAGDLDPNQDRSVREIVSTLVDDLAPRTADTPAASPVTRVLCVPARDEVDAAAALMLAQSLTAAGTTATALSPAMLTSELLELIATSNPAPSPTTTVVCISAVPPAGGAAMHARVVAKRLRARFPDLPIVIGLWNGEDRPDTAKAALGAAGTEYIVTTLPQALTTITALTGAPAASTS